MDDRLTTSSLAALLVIPAALGGARLVQARLEPELVGPGVISTEGQETFPAEDPVDGSLWFSRYEDDFDEQTIYLARRTGDGWAEPEVAPFSGAWGDRAPRFSPDGSHLYFTSNRPPLAGGEVGDMNIWATVRGEAGTWGPPFLVESPVSVAGAPDIHSAVTATGTVYLASRRPGSLGRSDIFRIPRHEDGYGEAEHLPPPINDELSQPDLFVSADESWMILVITDHPSGLGGDDLFFSRLENDEWSEPRNLGAPINSDAYEYGPTLSGDGQYLYFTSHRGGSANIYRVPVSSLGI